SFVLTTPHDTPGGETLAGAQDLYVGAKMATNKARGVLPESAFILQATLPTGSARTTAGRILPGAVYLAGWEVMPDRVSLSGALEADTALGDSGRRFVQLGHAINVRYEWTPRLNTFTEWVALHSLGPDDRLVTSQHYVHAGATWALNGRMRVDTHCYVGVSRDA